LKHDIESAKLALPLDRLMEKLGDGHLCKPKSKCPFHDDQTDSFSTFRADDGVLLWKCHAGCGAGDSVNYVAKKFGLSTRDSIARYCDLAGTNGHTHREPAGEVIVNTFSWSRCVANVTEKDTADIAKWRGYDPSFVEWLKFKEMLGCFESFPAFAVTDDKGLIVGCHYRIGNGTWRYGPGTGIKTSPLVIGDLKTATEAHVHEGAWDLFAEIERMGWHFDGFKEGLVLVATRGAGNAKTLAGKIPKTAKVVLWPQNDKVKKEGEKTPAEKWTAAMKDVIEQEVTIANVPDQYKDLNDWTRAGATPAMLNEVMESARQIEPEAKPELPAVMPWLDVQPVPDDDDSVLLGPGRWITRGSGVFLIAPTGVGKSTWAATQCFVWALGRPSLGIVPKRELKSLVVQSEDDQGDLHEMMAAIVEVLNPTEEERQTLSRNAIICTERAQTGEDFLKKVLRPLLAAHRPDIVWLNPLSAFFGGDLNRQQEVAKFFRNTLNPMLAEFGCAAFVVHHISKPSKEKSGWDKSDLNYLGAGSADLANWSRETIILREVGDGLFEMVCNKRWRRLDWTDDEGKPCRERLIAYGTGGQQFWRLANDGDLEKSGRAKFSEAALVALIPDGGIDKAELVEKAEQVFALSKRTAGSHVKWLSKSTSRTVNGHKLRCALVEETKKPRRSVYPDGPAARAVVWLTRVNHFQDELHPQP
jgi:hypothetical protein